MNEITTSQRTFISNTYETNTKFLTVCTIWGENAMDIVFEAPFFNLPGLKLWKEEN